MSLCESEAKIFCTTVVNRSEHCCSSVCVCEREDVCHEIIPLSRALILMISKHRNNERHTQTMHPPCVINQILLHCYSSQRCQTLSRQCFFALFITNCQEAKQIKLTGEFFHISDLSRNIWTFFVGKISWTILWNQTSLRRHWMDFPDGKCRARPEDNPWRDEKNE